VALGYRGPTGAQGVPAGQATGGTLWLDDLDPFKRPDS